MQYFAMQSNEAKTDIEQLNFFRADIKSMQHHNWLNSTFFEIILLENYVLCRCYKNIFGKNVGESAFFIAEILKSW